MLGGKQQFLSAFMIYAFEWHPPLTPFQASSALARVPAVSVPLLTASVPVLVL